MSEGGEASIFMLGGGESGYATCPSCLVNVLAILERHDDKVAMGTALTVLANLIHQQVTPHERKQFLDMLPIAMGMVLAKADGPEALRGPAMGNA